MRKLFLLFFIFVVTAVLIAEEDNKRKHRKVIYKKHTTYDFSGEKVEGKIRAPEIFYIFQRKRSKIRKIATVPESLNYHKEETRAAIKGALPE